MYLRPVTYAFPSRIRFAVLAAVVCASLLGCPRPNARSAPREATPELGDILAPSLRGQDELAAAPVRPRPGPPPVRWEGPVGRRVPSGWVGESRSIGSPNRGSLDRGRELEQSGLGWLHGRKTSFGTDELVAAIVWATYRVVTQFPDTVPVVIGDLSANGGGSLKPHRSHQSGRDVDIGYYFKGNRPAKRFVPADAATLDTAKTWALLEAFLMTGMVQYVFVDYRLQPLLRAEAEHAGWGEADLEQFFQYPRPRGTPQGIIRHAKGHDDHFHLRIECPAGDGDCRR